MDCQKGLGEIQYEEHGHSPSFLEAMEDTTVGFRPKLLDFLAEAEKGGRFTRLIPLSETDMTRSGYKQHGGARPQWIFGEGPQKGSGSDPAT